MKNIITDKNNVIKFITAEAIEAENGISTEDYFIGIKGLTIYNVDSVPVEVVPQKYCYDGIDFSANVNYEEPFGVAKEEILKLQNENIQLKAQIALQDSAIMELASMVSELSGGVA